MADKQLWQVTPVATDVKNDDGVIIGGQTAGTRYAPLTLIANFVHNLWAAFVNALTPLKTSFANGDKFPVVNGSTATAMEASKLLELTAQNALAGNVASAYDETGDTTYLAGTPVSRGGKTYVFKVNHSGAWNPADVYLYDDALEKLIAVTDEVFGKVLYSYYPLSNPSTGYNYDATGSLVANANSSYEELTFGADAEGKKLVIEIDPTTNNNDGRNYVIVNGSNVVVEHVDNGTIHSVYDNKYTSTAVLHSGYKLKASWTTAKSLPDVKVLIGNISGLKNDVESIDGRVTTIEHEINGYEEKSSYSLALATTGYQYDSTGSLVEASSSSYINIALDASNVGKKITIKIDPLTGTNDGRYYVIVDGSDNVVEFVDNGTIKQHHACVYESTNVIQSGYHLKASWRTALTAPEIFYIASSEKSIIEKVGDSYVKYVATTGNDDNDGSEASPVKTISKAVELGAETIIVSEGVYTDTEIDLSASVHDIVTIKGKVGKSAIFKRSDAKLVDSGLETLVSGYTKVYSVPLDSDPSYSGARQWLFFDGLNDPLTEIPADEIHPLQRGKFYRCDCAVIVKSREVTLSDALDDIENSDEYKWYYDGGKLYFSRAADTSTYPIYRGCGTTAKYFTTRENQSVVLENLEFRYSAVNLEKLNCAEISNVSAKYVFGSGAFLYDNSIAVVFDHCEAARAFANWNGDGFNAHVSSATGAYNKYCQATLRECWAHDNNDDGYSDHEYSEATIDGGLYEWNDETGIAPANGSHCVVKNAWCQRNANGFYYASAAIDSGNGGQMICYSCMSYKNNKSGGDNGGYRINGAGNTAILVNCKSYNDYNSFVCETGCMTRLYDCGYTGNVGNAFKGAGTFEKVKFNIVE